MTDKKVPLKIAQQILAKGMAGHMSDPRVFGNLGVMPNPDPILRKMGWSGETYDAIMSDAHVIGELRAVRANLIGYEHKLVESKKSKKSTKQNNAVFELVNCWLDCAPDGVNTWQDVVWQMYTAVLYGYRVHELIWSYDEMNKAWLPSVVDRPGNRFVFDHERKLKLLTKDNRTYGIDVPDHKFVVTRHMPTTNNPYGRSLLSSCFWPYTFKHGGFKFFFKFCERFGMPWPVGRYPRGTSVKEQNDLLDALSSMIESGAMAILEGSSVELLESGKGGESLAQKVLIDVCNKEMSKALTSQTLATEQGANGSRAAAETHKERSDEVSVADRLMIQTSINHIIRSIVELNFGTNALEFAPRFELYQQPAANKERAEVYAISDEIGVKISKSAYYEEFNMVEPTSDDDVLNVKTKPDFPRRAEFSNSSQHTLCACCGQQHAHFFEFSDAAERDAASIADDAIEKSWLTPAYQMLLEYEQAGKSLLEYQNDLPKLFGSLSDSEVVDITKQVMQLSAAQGAEAVHDESKKLEE